MVRRIRILTFASKLLIAMVAAVVLPSLAMLVVLILSSRQAYLAEKFSASRDVAEVTADRIRDFTDELSGTLQSLGLVTEMPPKESRVYQATLVSALNRYSYLDGIILRDSKGDEYKAAKNARQPWIPPAKVLQSAFHEASGGRTYFSPVFLSRSGSPVMVFAMPVFLQGHRLGGEIAGIINLKTINDIVQGVRVSRGSALFVVDSTGTVLAYTPDGRGMIGRNLSGIPFVRKAFGGGIDQAFQPQDEYVDPAGKRVVGVYRYVPDLRWSVIVQQPSTAVFGLNYIQIERALLWTLGFALLFLLVGLRLIATIAGPLAKLREGAEVLGSGDLRYRIAIHTGDELEELADTLNKMADHLQNSRRHLEAEQNKAISSAREASTLYRVSQALVSSMDLRTRLDIVAEMIASVCQTKKTMIWLMEGNRIVPNASFGLDRAEQELFTGWNVRTKYTAQMTRESISERKMIVIKDARGDSRIPAEITQRLGFRSVLSLPIVYRQETIGYAITYEQGKLHQFSTYQLRIVQGVAHQAAVAIANSRTYERERRIAETLQRLFLPSVPRSVGQFDIADEYAPALREAEIGGDFYDIVELSPNRIALVIADISGKGLGAAVHTAFIKYVLRAYAVEEAAPEEIVKNMNRAFFKYVDGDVFVTLFYGVLDVEARELVYVNAGHELPLMFGGDRNLCLRLETTGTALGVIEEYDYTSRKMEFLPGDALLMYTDGATEARRGSEFLGIDGLEEIFCSVGNMKAPDIVTNVNAKLRAYSGGALHDDVALLVVKHRRSEQPEESHPMVDKGL